MANYTKTALKGAAIFFVMSLFAGFLGYLVRFVLARKMSLAEYGLFYAVFTLFAMLSIFRDMGIGQALVKYIAEFNVNKKYGMIKGSFVIGFMAQMAMSFIIYIILLIFSKQISLYFFHTYDAMPIILLLAVMFILMPIEKIFSFAFQGFQRIDFNSLIEFVRMLLVLIFIFIIFRYNASAIAPSLAYIIAYIIEGFIFAPLFLRTFPQFFKVKAVLTKELAKKIFLFGLPVMIGLVGSMIITYTDTLVITYFRTLEEVALYQVAMPTAKLLLYFTGAISMVVLPMSSELWARKLKQKLILGVDNLYRYSFVLIIPLALLMVTYPEIIIKVFFGQKYVEAAFTLQILAIAGIIYTICLINSNVLSGIGKPKENAKIILIAAIFNLVFDIILVPYIGINGAAIATLASYVIILIMTGREIKSALNVPMPWLSWMKNIVAGFLFLVIVTYLKSSITIFNDITEMVVIGGIGFAVYAVFIILFKVVDMKEIIGIIRYAMKK